MYFTEASLMETAERVRVARRLTPGDLIREIQRKAELRVKFDIFMSHAYLDRDKVAGLVLQLEEMGYTVYLDWLYDGDLSRQQVTARTAQRLRERMVMCKSLFYATTRSSSDSKWMPWECGFFDGFRGKVAICPVLKATDTTFKGQEYLALYPEAQKEKDGASNSYRLWIHESQGTKMTFEEWLGRQSLVEKHK